jgi:hypothetical protein
MPRSKKGRLSGGARKEINTRRGTDIVLGAIIMARPDSRSDPASEALKNKAAGMLFARVSKIIDANHALVAINTKRGPKELRAEIPPLLSKRGATPISTGFIVAVFFGKDFDPDVDEIRPADHFGIEVIIEKKQAYTLQKEGVIPSWMVQDADKTDAADLHKDEKGGFEFDYSEKAGEDEEESSEEEGGRRKSNDDDVDIDDI